MPYYSNLSQLIFAKCTLKWESCFGDLAGLTEKAVRAIQQINAKLRTPILGYLFEPFSHMLHLAICPVTLPIMKLTMISIKIKWRVSA